MTSINTDNNRPKNGSRINFVLGFVIFFAVAFGLNKLITSSRSDQSSDSTMSNVSDQIPESKIAHRNKQIQNSIFEDVSNQFYDTTIEVKLLDGLTGEEYAKLEYDMDYDQCVAIIEEKDPARPTKPMPKFGKGKFPNILNIVWNNSDSSYYSCYFEYGILRGKEFLGRK